jgi:hypothetical protein
MHNVFRARPRPRLIAPASLPVVAWWNASDLSDGVVASWAPTIGGPTPVQATEAAKPIRSSTSFNGKPGVTFDGSDDFMRVDATTNLPTSSTPGTIWMAYIFTSGNNSVLFRYGGTTTGVRSIGRGTTATGGTITDGTSNGTFGMSPAASANIVAGFFDATIYQAYSLGFGGLAATGATLNTSTTRTTIGANNAATAAAFVACVIRHVMVTTAMTTAQRYALEGWLAWDCGLQHMLPAYHPYRWAVA